MNMPISEQTQERIRSQVESSRFSSEEAVIEEAVRRLEGELAPRTVTEPPVSADQDLQQLLFAAGLLNAVQLAAVLKIQALTPSLILVSADLDLNVAAIAEGLSAQDPNDHP